MKRVLALVLGALGLVALRRQRAARNEADLWHEATTAPDLRRTG